MKILRTRLYQRRQQEACCGQPELQPPAAQVCQQAGLADQEAGEAVGEAAGASVGVVMATGRLKSCRSTCTWTFLPA